MRNVIKTVCLLGMFVYTLPGSAAEITTGTDEQAQLPYWQVSDIGMSLRLVQRLPMQTRGFFLARGFSKAQTERIAQSCVFQTVFKNLSADSPKKSALTYNLNDWQVLYKGEQRTLKTREEWAKEWQQEAVPKPVQLAFEWALYPTQQVYQPGDYNWGMTVYNLPPVSVFDLKVVWQQFGKQHQTTIRNMRCADDREEETGE